MHGQSGDDEQLMAAVAAGDRRAFDRLVARHLGRVHAVAARVVASPAEAEDVAQEVFLKVWGAAGRYRPARARFTTWLYRVTINQAVNHRSRVMRRDRPMADAGDPPDPAPGAEATLLAEAEAAALARAVADLPDNQRLAISLTYTAGLPNAEAAAAMRVSLKAFEALLVRARRRLRTWLADLGDTR
jgi:RNA polymerase sigma-70 factor (ECF subfamily)